MEEGEPADEFPVGMHVLAIDDDPTCLKLLENLLLHCQCNVMSANGDTKAVMKGITHGACDYLLKPIRIEEVKKIWQHVVKRKFDMRHHNNGESSPRAQLPNSESMQGLGDPNEAVPKKILDLMNVENLTRENVASHLQVRL